MPNIAADEIRRESAAGQEARRVMTICNACRYCEGLCATFQAMAQRRHFPAADLDYLANLCHNCTACYHACPYSPPHSFAVNVPRAFSELRLETYQKYAWPASVSKLFAKNGLVVFLTTALVLALTMALVTVAQESATLFARHTGPGSFYRVVSHGTMVLVAGTTFGFAVLALIMTYRGYRRSLPESRPKSVNGRAMLGAIRNAAVLKYLDGGHGEGCGTKDDGPSNLRRYFHQVTMWGFVLCFASTAVAAIYDFGFGRIAPYDVFSAPVLLGTAGGIGLLVGPAGLLWVKTQSDARPMLVRQYGMDYAFLALLFLISLTGLLLLAFRETSAMGIMLAIHLGLVLALFVAMPYSKFVHAVYRFAALVRFAEEKQKASDFTTDP